MDAVLLAAGRSARMGQDKALLRLGEEPLWRRQQRVLREAGAQAVFLSARPEQSWISDADGFATILYDARPDCGPIMGVMAALERTECNHLAVLAVDLPHMTAAWFRELHAECERGIGAVGWHRDAYEPLAAIYPRELIWTARARIAEGKYSLQSLLALAEKTGILRRRRISDIQADWFENWNEP